MGICRKKFMWSNLLILLLTGSLLDWYVVFSNPYMASSGLLGPCLKNLAMFFNSLIWIAVKQIIQFFIVTRVLVYLSCSICWWHCSYRQWSPWHLTSKTTPLSTLSDQRCWQTQIFLGDWGSTIEFWYCYLSKKICIGYFGGNWVDEFEFCWYSHGSQYQTSTQSRGASFRSREV